MKTFASLIVMVSSSCCAQIKYLGVPAAPAGYLGYPAGLSGLPYGIYGGQPTAYTAETLSPSIYPLRTALDALNTFPSYAPGFRVPSYPFSNAPAVMTDVDSVTPVQNVPASLLVSDEPNVIEAVDVASEDTDEDTSNIAGLITIAEEIDSLPNPPTSLFRDPTPVIPAGIAQATQPVFHQQLFKNPKLSPILVQFSNSKDSPVLQQIRGQGAIIV